MRYPPTAERARISEIFSSIQGEGIYQGDPHIFLRFEECHRHCAYCDEAGKPARFWTREEALVEIERLEHELGKHTFVSFTGGEPLLYVPFLKPLMGDLKKRGYRLYLETSGLLWQVLGEVIDLCDCIAMDIKPSSVTGEKNCDEDHARFLALAARREVFVKFTLSERIDLLEFEREVDMIHSISGDIPVVLQAVTETEEDADGMLAPEWLSDLRSLAARKMRDVRILPRLHKLLHLR